MNNESDDPDLQSFAFKTDASGDDKSKINSLLVDCTATARVVTDASKFTCFDERFDREKHILFNLQMVPKQIISL